MDESSETALPARPFLVFDGDCSFCRAWIEYWKLLTGDRVLYAPYQHVAESVPKISREEFASAVKLILPDGEVRSGAHAVFTTLSLLPGKSWPLWMYDNLPGFAPTSEAAYDLIAHHRSAGYRVTQLLWGIPLQLPSYAVASWLFLRLLGAIYLVAFLSFGVQASGLIGSHGILPVAEFLPAVKQYLGNAAYWNAPTLLWLSSSDLFLRIVWIAGICASVAFLVRPRWRILRITLFVLYLSLVTAGQVFMGYQWDALLLEAGFLAIFLGSSRIVVWLFRWLLFRLMFLSGAVKLLSGDPSWRHFTALPVHYESQPLPTPLAWYFFQLPNWFQHVSVGFVFFVEVLVPFLIFFPRRARFFAAWFIVLLQILIFLTGNYAFFNLLAISLCIFLLDDQHLRLLWPKRFSLPTICTPAAAWKQRLRTAICSTLAFFVLVVSGYQLIETFAQTHFAPMDVFLGMISPFQVVNTYGLFAVMTTTRPEIIVEGSNDGTNWLAYEFKYKPGDLRRRPVWVQPHQPRLDWQMWFAALSDYHSESWIVQFMAKLLQGSPDVLHLLRANPFPGAPPRFVRATLYEYEFTTRAERRATGDWWRRELKGSYLPPVSLRSP